MLKFTDTFADINGVCRFIQNIAQSAHTQHRDLTVFTSTRMALPEVVNEIDNVVNFAPIFAMKMPGYETLDLAIPPLIAMLRAADEFNPDVIHISTPGAVGTVGMIAAKLMRVPIVGVYHTDFPAYIDELFENRFASWMCRSVMSGFYRQFKYVFSRSADYADRLVELGLKREQLVRLRAGYDDTKFDAALRDVKIWNQYHINPNSIKAVFCGRVSTEKNLPMLVQIWPEVRQRVRDAGKDIELIIVGDGPYRTTMEKQLENQGTHFLGFKGGVELATIYASCDFFVFPSTTDTLGQVVMESQASGLPVIVTDQGGPKEIVDDQSSASPTAFVLAYDDRATWIDTIVELALNDELRTSMGRNGIRAMSSYTFDASFTHYWKVHESAQRTSD